MPSLTPWAAQVSIPVSAVDADAKAVSSLTWIYRMVGQSAWSSPQTAQTITVPSDGVYQIEVTATDEKNVSTTRTFYVGQDASYTPAAPGAPTGLALLGGNGLTVSPQGQCCVYFSAGPAQLGYDVSLPEGLEMQVSADGGQTWTEVWTGPQPPPVNGVYSPGNGTWFPGAGTPAGTFILRARTRDIVGLGDAAVWSDWTAISDSSIVSYDPNVSF
jgi:hypothetical protein